MVRLLVHFDVSRKQADKYISSSPPRYSSRSFQGKIVQSPNIVNGAVPVQCKCSVVSVDKAEGFGVGGE